MGLHAVVLLVAEEGEPPRGEEVNLTPSTVLVHHVMVEFRLIRSICILNTCGMQQSLIDIMIHLNMRDLRLRQSTIKPLLSVFAFKLAR
jgi:hypothetical protein